MPRTQHIKSAQQRYEMVPKLGPDGVQLRSKSGARMTVQDRSRPLAMPRCSASQCFHDDPTIRPGMAYKKVEPYSGATLYRHEECEGPFSWEYSDAAYAKAELVQYGHSDFGATVETWDDLATARDDIATAIRDAAQELEEKVANMVDGFGHETSASDEIQEQVDAFESWADAVDDVYCDDPGDEDGLEEEALAEAIQSLEDALNEGPSC